MNSVLSHRTLPRLAGEDPGCQSPALLHRSPGSCDAPAHAGHRLRGEDDHETLVLLREIAEGAEEVNRLSIWFLREISAGCPL